MEARYVDSLPERFDSEAKKIECYLEKGNRVERVFQCFIPLLSYF